MFCLRALGQSSWKHVSLSYDVSKKSEQLDWLRVLNYLQVAGTELPWKTFFFWTAIKKKYLGGQKITFFIFFLTDMKKRNTNLTKS